MDVEDLIKICDDLKLKESIGKPCSVGKLSRIFPNFNFFNKFYKKEYCLKASDIIKELTKEERHELLSRTREVIKNHGRDVELIQKVTKDFLQSKGYKLSV